MTETPMDAEDFADAVKDTLLNADAWTGGAIGLMPLAHEREIKAFMKGRGWIGPKEGLTRKGAAEARRIQEEAGYR